MLSCTYIVLDGLSLQHCKLASMTSLNALFVICLANNNCDVPKLSRVRDCIRDMWTPISLWIPEHSIHTIIPKLVESHVASGTKENKLVICSGINTKEANWK